MAELVLQHGAKALIDDEDFAALNAFHWYMSKRGYVVRNERISAPGEPYRTRVIYLHRQLLTPRPGFVVDHVNQNKLDNRRANLREATVCQNAWNTGLTRRNTSGIKGVNWNKANGRWLARMSVNGVVHYLGYFDDLAEAEQAYRNAAIAARGEYAAF